MSSQVFNRDRIPCLNMAWSSTTSTFILDIALPPIYRYFHLYPGPTARRRINCQGSSEHLRALLHAQQAGAPLAASQTKCLQGVEANAIIFNLSGDAGVLELQADVRAFRSGMAYYVGNRLLDN